MQLKDLKWDQQIKHVPLEGTTRDMLLAVIGGLVKRIEALEKPQPISFTAGSPLRRHTVMMTDEMLEDATCMAKNKKGDK